MTLDLNGRVFCVSYNSASVYAVYRRNFGEIRHTYSNPQKNLETVSFLKLPDAGIFPKSMEIDEN